MKISRSIVIDAPLDRVWKTAAHDFAEIDRWASLVHSSKAERATPPVAGAAVAGRVCETPFGTSHETFEAYDEERHTFTYAGRAEKQPAFLKRGSNTWSMEAVSESRTRLTMTGDIELNLFPGTLMRLPMRLQMRRVLDWNLQEIKHYIETGRPHPRKLKRRNERAAELARS